jgi:retinol dehydrogenase-12
MTPPKGSKTADGYELQWGTNGESRVSSSSLYLLLTTPVVVLGHYAFTEALLPVIVATAAVSPPAACRIVNTSSSAHM